MDDVWAHVSAERRTLADFLETLAPADWDVPSLCPAWRVRDVVAHMVFGPIEPPAASMRRLLRSGFRINRAVAEGARRWGQQDPATMIDRLRESADDRREPLFVTGAHVLADIVCHNLDVRRPLGRSRPMPPEPFRLTADLMAGTGGPLAMVFARSPRRTVRGVRLVAQDLDWTYGDGPEVYGTAESLLLTITGRPISRAELSGPGAPLLYERIS